jgi:hypothetical protein
MRPVGGCSRQGAAQWAGTQRRITGAVHGPRTPVSITTDTRRRYSSGRTRRRLCQSKIEPAHSTPSCNQQSTVSNESSALLRSQVAIDRARNTSQSDGNDRYLLQEGDNVQRKQGDNAAAVLHAFTAWRRRHTLRHHTDTRCVMIRARHRSCISHLHV